MNRLYDTVEDIGSPFVYRGFRMEYENGTRGRCNVYFTNENTGQEFPLCDDRTVIFDWGNRFENATLRCEFRLAEWLLWTHIWMNDPEFSMPEESFEKLAKEFRKEIITQLPVDTWIMSGRVIDMWLEYKLG